MASRLRVDEILPSVGNNIAIGTAIGSVSFANATYTVGTGASVFSPTTNTLAFGTNNTEKLRIDSSGNVGIGTDNPSTSLHLLGSNTASRGQLSVAGSAGAGARVSLYQGSTFIGHISGDTTNGIFHSTESTYPIIFGAGGSERARVTSTGNVQIANGNLVFSTSGTGIDFSATSDAPDGGSSTSELLDDYEEGTWSPTITWGGTSATLSASTYGYYTKIGNTVIINFRIVQTARNTTSGALRMQGLPYNEASSANYNHGMVQGNSGINMPAGAGSIMMYLEGGNHRWLYQTNTGHSDLNASECVDNTSFYGFATYFTS